MLEPTTAERLVRLRGMLEAALTTTADDTAFGRHTAVVALDGVCELAIGLAAHNLDLDTSSGGFPTLIRRLKDALEGQWEQDGAQGVIELHRARNDAQHFGMLPDPGHIPIWSAEVERFVRSLIAVAFGEELSSVFAASAIRDEELRAKLVEAETQLGAGVFGKALRASRDAFDTALRRFRSERGRTAAPFSGEAFRKFQEFSSIASTIGEVQTYLDVAVLASDPGEWLWLREVENKLHQQAEPPTEDDARRALAFALGWVLRFESFTARYATARVQWPEYEPPSPCEEYEKPRRVAIQRGARPVRGRDHIPFDIKLSHTPSEWMFKVGDGMRELQARGEAPQDLRVDLSADDVLGIDIAETLSAEEVLALADALIDATHAAYEGLLQMQREYRDGLEAAVSPYREAVAQANDERLGNVGTTHPASGEKPRITVSVDLPDGIAGFDVETAINEAVGAEVTPGRRAHLLGDTLSFEEGAIAPDQLAALFAQGVEEAQALKRERDEQEAARAAQHDKLVREVAALAATAPDVDEPAD